jgi:hypothetical protein
MILCKLWHRWFWWVGKPIYFIKKDGVLVPIKPDEESSYTSDEVVNYDLYCAYDLGKKYNYCTKCKREV